MHMGAPLHSHFSNDTLHFQDDHLFSRLGRPVFLLLRFFPFSLFFFFFWNATAYFAQFAIRGYAPGESGYFVELEWSFP